AKGLLSHDMTEGYVGWNVPSGSPMQNVGSRKETHYSTDMTGHYDTVTQIRPITNDAPTIQIFPLEDITELGRTVVHSIDLAQAPHYRYRLDYLLPAAQSSERKSATPIGPAPGPSASADDRKASLAAFNAAASNYRVHNGSPGNEKVIGRNNIGEITF